MEMWKVSDCVTCEWFWTPRNVNTGPRLNGDPWSTCLPPPNWDTSHGKCFQLLENSGWENINSILKITCCQQSGARWVSRLRDSHSCEQKLFLSVEGKGSPSKAPMISYNPSDMEAGVMIALRRDNIDLVSKSSEQLWMLVTSDGFLLLLASLWEAQCVGEKDETDKDQHS